MRVKSGAVVIDLIQEHLAGVVRIMADVELAASRLVACLGGGILPHQRQEGVDLFRIDLEIDNDDIHRIPLCQAALVIRSMIAAVTALVPMSPPNSIGRRVFAAKPASTAASTRSAASA